MPEANSDFRSRRAGRRPGPGDRMLLVRRAAIVAVLAVALFPILWLFTTAYKPGKDIFATPPQLVFEPTLANFAGVFRYFDLWSLLQSSLIIALGSTALSLVIGVPAGYALARAKSPKAVWAAYAFLAVRTVPPIDPSPNKVPCGPRSTSTRSKSQARTSGLSGTVTPVNGRSFR